MPFVLFVALHTTMQNTVSFSHEHKKYQQKKAQSSPKDRLRYTFHSL